MGLAFLPDGSQMDYDKYIKEHPHWQLVRSKRFEFDGGRCVICHHAFLPMERFETHHLNYSHLGNEHMRDVVTLCPACHTKFHNVWKQQDFWKGRERDHWGAFDIDHTARMCAAYYKDDRFICKDVNAPNLCNKDVQRQYIDRYFSEYEIITPVPLDPNDLGLFVRNKRYEMFFEAEKRGLSVDEFLDECYGEKVRGKNPIRQEAGKKGGTFDHTPKSFHRHYVENKNINMLMTKARQYEMEDM